MRDEATGDETQRAMCNDNKKPNDKRIIAVSTMRNPMGKGPGLSSFINGVRMHTHTHVLSNTHLNSSHFRA